MTWHCVGGEYLGCSLSFNLLLTVCLGLPKTEGKRAPPVAVLSLRHLFLVVGQRERALSIQPTFKSAFNQHLFDLHVTGKFHALIIYCIHLGGDWRHFGHLIGISTETIQFWRRLQLRAPMDQVLSFWKAHHTSDVRLLHRLLMSPQVRAMNLAKLVSEFYHVD